MLGWLSVIAISAALQGVEAPVMPAPPVISAGDALPVIEADWARRPSPIDLARLYPERATREKVSGEVDLACRIDAAGRLSDCSVSTETPGGYGFGEAALQLAASYMMRPERATLWAVSGHKAVVPIRFRADAATPERLPPGFVPRDGRVPLPRREKS
jgi:TonB family protein